MLQSWKGTPWRAGQCAKGQGVYCWFFGLAVLDELEGITAPMPRRVGAEEPRHSTRIAAEVIEELKRRYGGRMESVPATTVEPGDLIGFRFGKGDIGHVGIAGPDPFSLWHAQRPRGVVRSDVALDGAEIRTIGRMRDKARWIM